MGLTIANLKYQETDKSLMKHIRSTFDWLSSVRVLSGVKGKSTVNDISITGNLLRSATCSINKTIATIDLTGVNAGTGYTVLDVFTLEAPYHGDSATVRVDTVGGSGEITGVTLLTVGSNYTTGLKNTTGGTGTDATINVATITEVDTALSAKELELNYYNLSFPISNCDLKQTWLSAFADKYFSEEDVYFDALIPYLAEEIGDEFRTQFHNDIIAEATTDGNVTKVTLTGIVDTPSNSYATVQEFIDGLPSAFLAEALDEYSREWYYIQVSVSTYKLLARYLGDKVSSYGINIDGFNVVANKELSGNEMIAKSWKNDLLVIDDTEDIAKIKVVKVEWENKSYILTGLAFVGSYIDSKRIVISN